MVFARVVRQSGKCEQRGLVAKPRWRVGPGEFLSPVFSLCASVEPKLSLRTRLACQTHVRRMHTRREVYSQSSQSALVTPGQPSFQSGSPLPNPIGLGFADTLVGPPQY